MGGGGYYLYEQYTSPAKAFGYEYIILPGEQAVTPPVGMQSVGKSSSQRGKAKSNAEVNYSPSLSASPLTSASGVSGGSSAGLLSARSSNYAGKSTEKTSFYGSSSGSTLLALGSSARKSSSVASSTGSGGSGIISSTSGTGSTMPLTVPGMTETGGSLTGTAYVDPGGDPNENEMIPVGEGWWILLLLAGAYLGFRQIKR